MTITLFLHALMIIANFECFCIGLESLEGGEAMVYYPK